jgi:nucleoid-associated protein YgaU
VVPFQRRRHGADWQQQHDRARLCELGRQARRAPPPTPGAFRYGASTPTEGFDFSYGPDAINSFRQGAADGSYTVQGGETLAGIAQAVWGDSALWYKIAEANGLSADATLIEGQTLTLPAGVTRIHNNAST